MHSIYACQHSLTTGMQTTFWWTMVCWASVQPIVTSLKILIIQEPYGIFGSIFAYLSFLILSRHWYAKWLRGCVEHHFGPSRSFSEIAHNSCTSLLFWFSFILSKDIWPLDRMKLNQKSYYYLQNSAFWGWLSMGSQPQNPEFRNKFRNNLVINLR